MYKMTLRLIINALISLVSVCAAAQDRDALIGAIQPAPVAAIPTCTKLTYTSPPNDDVIKEMWDKRRKFRLVIGAGTYKLAPDKNRAFIAPTAALVDSKLEKLGYQALPSLQQHPFLVDSAATKGNIVAALKEMAQQVGKDGIGIVYYAGHGLITPSKTDLALGVYEEDVLPVNGLTVSNIIGLLGVDSSYVDSVDEIPNIFLVLESCESGEAAIGDNSVVVTDGDLQKVQKVQTSIIAPTRVAILAATTHGGNHDAYPLNGMNVSAFGYYFARALDEDWACSNDQTREGILVNFELQDYLVDRLGAAYKNHLIDGQMKPTSLPKDNFAMWAYRPDRQADCGGTPCIGNRNRFVRVLLTTDFNQDAELKLANGFHMTCQPGEQCSVIISSSFSGKLSITSRTYKVDDVLAMTPTTSTYKSKSGSADFGKLVSKGHLGVAGVDLKVQK